VTTSLDCLSRKEQKKGVGKKKLMKGEKSQDIDGSRGKVSQGRKLVSGGSRIVAWGGNRWKPGRGVAIL